MIKAGKVKGSDGATSTVNRKESKRVYRVFCANPGPPAVKHADLFTSKRRSFGKSINRLFLIFFQFSFFSFFFSILEREALFSLFFRRSPVGFLSRRRRREPPPSGELPVCNRHRLEAPDLLSVDLGFVLSESNP